MHANMPSFTLILDSFSSFTASMSISVCHVFYRIHLDLFLNILIINKHTEWYISRQDSATGPMRGQPLYLVGHDRWKLGDAAIKHLYCAVTMRQQACLACEQSSAHIASLPTFSVLLPVTSVMNIVNCAFYSLHRKITVIVLTFITYCIRRNMVSTPSPEMRLDVFRKFRGILQRDCMVLVVSHMKNVWNGQAPWEVTYIGF